MSLVKRQKPNSGSNELSHVNKSSNSRSLVIDHNNANDVETGNDAYQLIGHEAEVYAVDFDPSGQFIASGSGDKSILIWNIKDAYDGRVSEYQDGNGSGQLNYSSIIKGGHKAAVLDVKWSRDSRMVFSCSADTTVSVWDSETGQRIRKLEGHSDIVNSMDVVSRGTELIISASDDGYIDVFDPREKHPVSEFETKLPVLSVATDSIGAQIWSAGIDNEISAWDPRQKSVSYRLKAHTDSVTGLQVSPDSQSLVSNSLDGTVRTWDVRPFSPPNRALNVYDGAPVSLMEQNLIRASWSPDGKRLACGSVDRTVAIWDVFSRNLIKKLPGHLGTVNDVKFHPTDAGFVVSASSDKTLILGRC